MTDFRMQTNDDGVAELLIYDVIGDYFWFGISAQQVAQELREARGTYNRILVRINSPGGDVADGSAIYNTLVNAGVPVAVKVEGWAASAASVIMMAGDTIEIAENGLIMIHEAWSMTIGDKAEHAKSIQILDRINSGIANVYAARTGKKKDELLTMMADETWMDADEALDLGFADKKMPAKQKPDSEDISASAQARKRWSNVVALFKHAPDDVAMPPMTSRQAAAAAFVQQAPAPRMGQGHETPRSRVAAQTRGPNRWKKF